MATLLDDIHHGSDWVVKAFAELDRKLDYSLDSLKDIDLFFDGQTENGEVKTGGLLEDNFGYKIFALASYVGETLIKNCPGSIWVTDDSDPHGEVNISVKLANGHVVWPGQKVFKRFKNGNEDNIYMYANLVLEKGRRIYSKTDWVSTFGYKMAWIAIKGTSPEEVIQKVNLPEVQVVNWNEGINKIYEDYGKNTNVFITPLINKWVLLAGWYFGDFNSDDEKLGEFKKHLSVLSDIFEEVQAFATHRVSEYHHWVLAKNGKIERCFAYSGTSGGVLQNEGEVTDAEKDFRWDKLKSFEWFPDEEDVMTIAEKWSINPNKIDDINLINSRCYLINIPK